MALPSQTLAWPWLSLACGFGFDFSGQKPWPQANQAMALWVNIIFLLELCSHYIDHAIATFNG